jgi:hypothetical protein
MNDQVLRDLSTFLVGMGILTCLLVIYTAVYRIAYKRGVAKGWCECFFTPPHKRQARDPKGRFTKHSNT